MPELKMPIRNLPKLSWTCQAKGFKVPILQVVLLFRMQLWPVAHFWVGATAKQQQTHRKVSERKLATGQSCIPKRSTTCKIGTLVVRETCQTSRIITTVTFGRPSGIMQLFCYLFRRNFLNLKKTLLKIDAISLYS
jgi:hypothetical protein